MSQPLLTLKNVSRHFGGLKVLQDVNLEIPQGGIFGPVSYTHLTLPTKA